MNKKEFKRYLELIELQNSIKTELKTLENEILSHGKGFQFKVDGKIISVIETSKTQREFEIDKVKKAFPKKFESLVKVQVGLAKKALSKDELAKFDSLAIESIETKLDININII